MGLLGLYIGAQIVGLALSEPFRSEGFTSSSNPQSPTAPLLIIAVIIIAPLFILFFSRQRGGLPTLRHFILLAIAGSLYFTLYATFSIFPPGVILPPPYAAEYVLDPALTLAAIVSAGLYFALLVEPQWYVVDLAGFLAAGSLIAILGISFGILPAFILLLALMVYDAIAVYRTKHMVSLADAVVDMHLPILMVMPDSPGTTTRGRRRSPSSGGSRPRSAPRCSWASGTWSSPGRSSSPRSSGSPRPPSS